MIHAVLLLALLAGAQPGAAGDPVPSETPLSLAALLAAPPPVVPLQGVNPDIPPPRGWIAFSIYWVTSSLDLPPPAGEPDEDEPLGFEFGLYSWKGEMGLAVEVGVIHSSYKVDVTSEEVDVLRGLLGLRIADRGLHQMFTPWARAGVLYRIDDSDLLSDQGLGFYIGAGLDWRLAGPLALTPSFTYADSNSFGSQEWLLGLALTFLF